MIKMEVKISPLQLLRLVFEKINIETGDSIDKAQENWAPNFDFKDVEIKTEVTFGIKEGQEDNPTDFMISVRLFIENSNAEIKVPYLVDVKAHGWFELAPIYPVDKRESIMLINGGSMVVGAIREQILQITSRSAFGPLTIPSLKLEPK